MKIIPLDFDTNKNAQMDLLHAAVNAQFVTYKGESCKITISPSITEKTFQQINTGELEIKMQSCLRGSQYEHKVGLSRGRNIDFFGFSRKTYHLKYVDETHFFSISGNTLVKYYTLEIKAINLERIMNIDMSNPSEEDKQFLRNETDIEKSRECCSLQ